MRAFTPEQIAQAAGARLATPAPTRNGPERAVIDSREAGPGSLFVGMRGDNSHGGQFAAQALAAGAWGVLTTPAHIEAVMCAKPGVLLAAEDPLAAMQLLATAWRRELGARVIGVTGSTGKTSTKDLLTAMLAPHRQVVASRANFNTEIGLPLEILNAPQGTEVLVLEMAMRGAGQIAELAAIAEPDVGVIVSVGPVHLELLGSLEAIAAAKAELLAGMKPGGVAIVPADEALLAGHLRDDLETITFGQRGTVRLLESALGHVVIDVAGRPVTIEVSFSQAHLRANLLPAVAAATAIGVIPSGRLELTLSPGRGQMLKLPGGITLLDDCYNANPMSMRAALDHLAAVGLEVGGEEGAVAADRKRLVAVLGDMLELGPSAPGYHREVARHAERIGVELLVTVGRLAAVMGEEFGGEVHSVANAEEAAALLPELLQPGDVVLVKASRAIGLELVCEALAAGAPC